MKSKAIARLSMVTAGLGLASGICIQGCGLLLGPFTDQCVTDADCQKAPFAPARTQCVAAVCVSREDASVETPDAATMPDGAMDAAIDHASTSFCASRIPAPALCLDFDLDPRFGDASAENDGGTLAIDTDASASPPASLLTFLPASPGGPGARVGLSFVANADTPFTHIEEELDVHVIDCPILGTPVTLTSLSVEDDAGVGEVRLQIGSNLQLAVMQPGDLPPGNKIDGPPIPASDWFHVRVSLDIFQDQTMTMVHVYAGGQLSGPAHVNLNFGQRVIFWVGQARTNFPYACRIDIDNVVLDVLP